MVSSEKKKTQFFVQKKNVLILFIASCTQEINHHHFLRWKVFIFLLFCVFLCIFFVCWFVLFCFSVTIECELEIAVLKEDELKKCGKWFFIMTWILFHLSFSSTDWFLEIESINLKNELVQHIYISNLWNILNCVLIFCVRIDLKKFIALVILLKISVYEMFAN